MASVLSNAPSNLARSLRRLFAALALACALVPLVVNPASTSISSAVLRGVPLSVPSQGRDGFVLLEPQDSGVQFTNSLSEISAARNRVLVNGSGVALGDIDRDGLPDLFLCGLESPSQLFRNLGGMRFTNITAAAGLGGERRLDRGAVLADVNHDGWLDLLVSATGQGVLLWIHNGKGSTFTFSGPRKIHHSPGAMTMTLADVDSNGTLDLYVASYRAEDVRDVPKIDLHSINGKLAVPEPLKQRFLVAGDRVFEKGEPDQLLLNNGKGEFRTVSWMPRNAEALRLGQPSLGPGFRDSNGQPLDAPPRDWGLSAAFRDINGDGAPDLYVCNDYWTPDRLWFNDGAGVFRAAPEWMLPLTSANSMGVDFADFDRDGRLDFMVVDMLSRDPSRRKRVVPVGVDPAIATTGLAPRGQRAQNVLFRGRSDGTFDEIAWFAGVAASDWSWQPLFCDIDLDGFADLLIGAGHIADIQDWDANEDLDRRPPAWKEHTDTQKQQAAHTAQRLVDNRRYPRLAMPIVTFQNRGGSRFEERTESWGTSRPAIHHGMAMADLDGDGDLDLVVNTLNSPAKVFRNTGNSPRVSISLVESNGASPAIGAQLWFEYPETPIQSDEVVAGGRYLSGSDSTVVFASRSLAGKGVLNVRWRDGSTSRYEGVLPNHSYRIAQPARGGVLMTNIFVSPVLAPLFEDVSAGLRHLHHDAPIDRGLFATSDPARLAQLGPGVAWFDANGDGWDDLFLGSRRGGTPAAFLSDGRGQFKALDKAIVASGLTRDWTALLLHRRAGGPVSLFAGSSNAEDGLAAGAPVREYLIEKNLFVDSIPPQTSSVGPLCLGDVDGDGEVDLFVGGRFIPGRYPEPADSAIFLMKSGRWIRDEINSRVLQGAGMVAAALLADLTSDGWPELVLACEWGSLRIFRNQQGKLIEMTEEAGLNEHRGLWTSIAAGDFNGDGRLDLVAGNAGNNSELTTTHDWPLKLVFGPWSEPNLLAHIEAAHNFVSGSMQPRFGLATMAGSIPSLRDAFTSHERFAAASLEEVLKSLPGPVRSHTVNTLHSSLFLNLEGRWSVSSLPRECQWNTYFGIGVADFDGDGAEDLVLGAGERDLPLATERRKAVPPLLMRGNGKGAFESASMLDPATWPSGNQRSVAVADFNHDARPDVAITTYLGATKLLRNRMGLPGIRVRLEGPPGNPAALGALVRLSFPGFMGPARAVIAGSGHYAQDSTTIVLARPSTPSSVWVRWPGGRETTTAFPPNADALTVHLDGRVTVHPQRPSAQNPPAQ